MDWTLLFPSLVILIFLMLQIGQRQPNSSDEEDDGDDSDGSDASDAPSIVEKRDYQFYPRTILSKANRQPDFLFRAMYRMNRVTFQELLNVAGQFIPIGRSVNNMSLQPPDRLLMFLRHLGGNGRLVDHMVIILMLHTVFPHTIRPSLK